MPQFLFQLLLQASDCRRYGQLQVVLTASNRSVVTLGPVPDDKIQDMLPGDRREVTLAVVESYWTFDIPVPRVHPSLVVVFQTARGDRL